MKGKEVPPCKWLSDDFMEICCNGDCPACTDFCPTTNFLACAAMKSGKNRNNKCPRIAPGASFFLPFSCS